jgi:molybdopterin converting factor small subunit
MEIKVLFFGVLTEVTGCNVKYYANVSSVGDLRLRIQDDYPEIVHYNYMISLNQQLINGESALNNGDEVAFLPPFAGG